MQRWGGEDSTQPPSLVLGGCGWTGLLRTRSLVGSAWASALEGVQGGVQPLLPQLAAR